MDQLFTAEALVSLLTLTFLEIVPGIDNIIFISIQAGKLPRNQQERARRIGLILALFVRIGLLFGISMLQPLDLIVTVVAGGLAIALQRYGWKLEAKRLILQTLSDIEESTRKPD